MYCMGGSDGTDGVNGADGMHAYACCASHIYAKKNRWSSVAVKYIGLKFSGTI